MNVTPTNDLRHLFDGTHCLSKRQLRDYAASFSSSKAGSMSREEAYAVESHLNTCPLCSAAVDGMLAHFAESADVLATVDAGFLKEHFKKHSPQIHLNTVAPAATAPVTRRIPGSTRVIDLTTFRTVGIAAATVLLIGSLWWFQNRSSDGKIRNTSAPIAQAEGRHAASPDGVASSPVPEGERRLAQAAPAVATRERAGVSEESEKKKTTDDLLAEADAALGSDAPLSAMAPPAAKPATTAAPAPTKDDMAAVKTLETKDAAKFAPFQKFEDASTARRYSRPLIEPAQPSSRSVLADKEIEKMPSRSTAEVAATSPGTYQSRSGSGVNIGGGRSENTVYIVDGVKQVSEAKKASDNGKALYKKGSYAAALKVFKQQMASTSGAAREEAMLYAARCHSALGQEKAAEKLLRELADGKGSNARAARRELRNMDASYNDEEQPTRRASRRSSESGD